ncbi:phospholipase D-like domain-containing protein [Pelomonas cellulosilytica]|uniref:phospholipase D n=1 Tax=Pelomonas cellulosilytica TaxID=2906762 RepID=A0ABS8XM87_9BURK|nr:phospholipase D-like domain-containing protein [Pelomonas sp. P8]MCE4553899.1 phospholipase D-like domain-containing protein [Pelomonas sp. P8]
MSKVKKENGTLAVVAHRGDAKTLLAFDLLKESAQAHLAGFTIRVKPPGGQPYFLHNNLRFEHPGQHAQDPSEPAFSSLNAPFHKFRWLHVPGSVHQGLEPSHGTYEYGVTPRYFDTAGSLAPLDPKLTVAVQVPVAPFEKGRFKLGFTRGFTQSQAFVRHFGLKASIKPKDADLLFDTTQVSGTNARGEPYTYEQQYRWLGFTARSRIIEVIERVLQDRRLKLDVFAYDLNEPGVIGALRDLGRQKRVRIILDDASLHHDRQGSKPEDKFAQLFNEAVGDDTMLKRGHFGRFAHDKVLIVKQGSHAEAVLTGSTNFSVTGLYVNSNHVAVFEDADVAAAYAEVFDAVWKSDVSNGFAHTELASKVFSYAGSDELPAATITFSPHEPKVADELLQHIVDRIQAEEQVDDGTGSILFAVMEMDAGATNPVYEALADVHKSRSIFSFGISDNPPGIELYGVGTTGGVLVTGKPIRTQLPPPFSQVPNIGGFGHQIHHKFIVCGFNGADPTVFFGSSNLAAGGEKVNGDNLITVKDGDVATVFAIEALALVDHFSFLDSTAQAPKAAAAAAMPATASKQQAAAAAGWFLTTDDRWAHKFFDAQDLHCRDRLLFAR